MAEGLTIRKLADRSKGTRIDGFHPLTGEQALINPDSGLPEPWPEAGIRVESAPKKATIPTSTVSAGVAEGWIELVAEQVVHRPGGPPEDPWRVTHTFRHAEAIVLRTVDGEIRYKVTRQPDKYPAEKDGELGFGGEVYWAYDATRQG